MLSFSRNDLDPKSSKNISKKYAPHAKSESPRLELSSNNVKKPNDNPFGSSSNDLVSHQSSSSIEKLDDKFCGAFQEHYEYLMDKGLIETCQFSGTQQVQSDYENRSGNVSFKEFLHQYNELKKWLDQMQSLSYVDQVSSCCEKYTNQIFYEEILKRSPRRELLNEYACHLVKYHPHLKHDVLSKLNYLNKQWRSMEFSIISKRYFNEDIARDLQEDMKNFEIWLQKVESIVEHLCIKPDWTIHEIEKNLNEHKCLQADIESHARIINSVLKLSNKLKQACKDCNHFHEASLQLQNRWHCLWLKSLEWQCRLEQEVSRMKVSIDKNVKKVVRNKDPIEAVVNTSSARINDSVVDASWNEEETRISTSSKHLKPLKTAPSRSLRKSTSNKFYFYPNNCSGLNSNDRCINWSHISSASSSSSSGSGSSSSIQIDHRLVHLLEHTSSPNDTLIIQEESSAPASNNTTTTTNKSSSSSFAASSNSNSSSTDFGNEISCHFGKPYRSLKSANKYQRRPSPFVRAGQQTLRLNSKSILKYLKESAVKEQKNFAEEGIESNDDIIPFDDFEYEKIISTSSSNCSDHTNSIDESHNTPKSFEKSFEEHKSSFKRLNSSLENSSANSRFVLKIGKSLWSIQSSADFLAVDSSLNRHQIRKAKSEASLDTMSETNIASLILNNSIESSKSSSCGSENSSNTSNYMSPVAKSKNSAVCISSSSSASASVSDKISNLSKNVGALEDDKDLKMHDELNNSAECKMEASKMKSSRTESEISKHLRKSNHYHSRRHFNGRRKTLKRDLSSLNNNDLSYYYSLTDVKYYNIGDEDDEEENNENGGFQQRLENMSSSLSSSSLSTSSLSKSSKVASSLSFSHSVSSRSSSVSSPVAAHDDAFVSNNDYNSMFAEGRHRLKKSQSVRGYRKSFSDYCMSNKTAKSSSANAEGPDSDSNKPNPTPSIFERMKNYRRNLTKNDQLGGGGGYDSSSMSEAAKDDMWNRAEEVVDNISFTFDNSFNEDEIKQSIESISNKQYMARSKRKKLAKSSSASPSSPLSSNYNENENGDEADNDDYDNEDENEINNLRNKWRRSNIASKTFDGCFSILADKNSGNDLALTNQQQNSIATDVLNENSRSKATGSILQSHQEIIDSLNETNVNSATSTTSSSSNQAEVSALTGSTVVVDETTNEANTDVSDPHWDGYTSSPFYSNSVTVEDVCINEKAAHIQPILPWDELFFELEPIDDTPAIKLNVPQRKWRNKRSSTNCNHHHNNKQHHHHAHNNHHHHSHNCYKIGSSLLNHHNFKLASNERLPFNLSGHKSHHNHHHSAHHHHQKSLLASNAYSSRFQLENCKYVSGRGANKIYCHESLKECCCCGGLKLASSSKYSRSFSSSENYSSSSSSETSGLSGTETATNHHQSSRHHHQLFASPRHHARVSPKNMHNLAKACRRFKSASSSSSNEDEFDLQELAGILHESLRQWDSAYTVFIRVLSTSLKLTPGTSKLHKQQSQLATTRTTSSTFKFKYGDNKELNFRKINTVSNEKLTTTTTSYVALFIQTSNPSKFNELLDACQTNISCLESIKSTVESVRISISKQQQHTESKSKSKPAAPLLVQQQQGEKHSATAASSSSSTIVVARKEEIKEAAVLDYYLFQLNEIIDKWKMLESLGMEEQKVCADLVKLSNELAPLRANLEYLNNLCKESNHFDSFQRLEERIYELDNKRISLMESLNDLNRLKSQFEDICSTDAVKNTIDLQVFDDFNRTKLKIVEASRNTIGKELKNLEDLQKCTSVDLKTKIKRLENFLELWRNVVDQEHQQIGQTLEKYKSNLFSQVDPGLAESKKFSPIGDGDLNFMLANGYDRSGIALNFTFDELKKLESAIEAFEKNVHVLNDDYSSLFAYSSLAAGGSSSTSMTTSATSSTTTMANFITDVIETYLLHLEKFKAELDFFYRLLMKSRPSENGTRGQIDSKSSTSTIPKIVEAQEFDTSNSGFETFKLNHESNGAEAADKSAEMPKLVLDLDDSYDGKFQMTSTPRYGIQKPASPQKQAGFATQSSNYLLSATTQTSIVVEPVAKVYCDKSMATVDDKSSQTDAGLYPAENEDNEESGGLMRTVTFKSMSTPASKIHFVSDKLGHQNGESNHHDEKAFRSMDSGIQTVGSGAALNKTNTTSSSEIDAGSASLPFSYRFEFAEEVKKSGESSEFEADLQNLDSSSESSDKNESQKSDSATLQHHQSQAEEAATQSVPSEVATTTLETPESSFETETRERKSGSELHGLLTPEASIQELKVDTSPEKDENEIIDREIENIAATLFDEKSLREEARKTFELRSRDQIRQKQPQAAKKSRQLSKKFIFYSIFVMILLGIALSMILNYLNPSCCDNRRQFLIFNEKTYTDDEYRIPC